MGDSSKWVLELVHQLGTVAVLVAVYFVKLEIANLKLWATDKFVAKDDERHHGGRR